MASGGKKKVGFFCFHALSFTPVEFLENIRKKKKESFFFQFVLWFFLRFKAVRLREFFFFFCNSRSVFQIFPGKVINKHPPRALDLFFPGARLHVSRGILGERGPEALTVLLEQDSPRP